MNLFTPEELVGAAAAWFGSLGQWPEETVAQVVVQNHRAKIEGPSYYGVAAALLMLEAANGGAWPPLSPKSFAAGLSEPRMTAQIVRYAKNVILVEARKDLSETKVRR